MPFIAAVLAYVWLGESILAFELFAMVCCFGGIAVVAVSDQSETSGDEMIPLVLDETSGRGTSAYQIGLAMAILAAAMYALGGVATRRLKALNFAIIQFHYAVISTFLTGVWLAYSVFHTKEEGDSWYVFGFTWSFEISIKLFGMALTTYFGSILVTCMNQSTNPATVGLFLYVQIVYDLCIDYLVFDTTLNGMQCLGAAICLIFSASTAIYKQNLPKEQTNTKTITEERNQIK